MTIYQKLDGSVHISAREYEIAADTAVKKGQLVRVTGNLVVPCAINESSVILGVAAEEHSGVHDDLNPRADGTKILVVDDPLVMMESDAPVITAVDGCTATTLSFAGGSTFLPNSLNGSVVELVSKAAGSTNTDEIGTKRRVSTFATDSTKGVLTLESGGAACAGDVYRIYPPVGFSRGNLSADATAFVMTGSVSLPIRVSGRDIPHGKIRVIICKHIFASQV